MTLLKLFGVLFAVNLLTIGGGYVSLPLLHRFLVEDLGWLTRQELGDAVAIGQLAPGPMTIMNVFIGQKIAGFPGAVTAAIATYLPCVAVGVLAGRSYARLRDSAAVAAVLRGMKPAVVGMLLAVALQLAEVSFVHPAAIAIGLGSLALMTCTRLDPTLVVLIAGVAGAVLL
ncbi:MAG TPA: chromate transporter [Anaeromyxobacter sp.]|nr:chromate transporter [Anaeromyxobacter sp.]